MMYPGHVGTRSRSWTESEGPVERERRREFSVVGGKVRRLGGSGEGNIPEE